MSVVKIVTFATWEKSAALGQKGGLQVLEHLAHLRAHVAGPHDLAGRVQRHLPGDEQEVANPGTTWL